MNKYLFGFLFFVLASSGSSGAQVEVKEYAISPRGAAYKKIFDLESERHAILILADGSFTLSQQKRLQEIENEIHQIKLFVGDVWSMKRKILLGTIALLGFSSAALVMHATYFEYNKLVNPYGW